MKKLLNIEDIRGAVAPVTVEISGWDPDEAFEVVLRKPGLVALQMRGGVPNPILATIEEMYMGKVPDKKADPEASKKTAEAIHQIAKAALVKPTMDELTELGAELTTQQYNEIYAFVLGGVDAIARFRGALRAGTGEHGEAVQDPPVGTDGTDRPARDVDGGRGDSAALHAHGKGSHAKGTQRRREPAVG